MIGGVGRGRAARVDGPGGAPLTRDLIVVHGTSTTSLWSLSTAFVPSRVSTSATLTSRSGGGSPRRLADDRSADRVLGCRYARRGRRTRTLGELPSIAHAAVDHFSRFDRVGRGDCGDRIAAPDRRSFEGGGVRAASERGLNSPAPTAATVPSAINTRFQF